MAALASGSGDHQPRPRQSVRQAATNAAPQAIQVADRWHLLHNMTEAMMEALAPHHRLLNEAARAAISAEAPAEQTSNEASSIVAFVTCARRFQQENRQRRLDRYEVVMEKAHRGLSQREIGRQCGLSRKTVRRWLRAGEFPERKRSLRCSAVDAHREYLEQRWLQGCHNAAQLWRELQAQGFPGRPHTLRDWLQKQYGRRGERNKQRKLHSRQPRISPRQTAWRMLKQPEPFLDELNRRSPEIATLAATAREFCRIVQQRDTAAWPRWLSSAARGPLASFAKHLCRDEAAFLAALQPPWSNGPVEGHVHRLKLIKRSMYGRANFDLLRLRVLHIA